MKKRFLSSDKDKGEEHSDEYLIRQFKDTGNTYYFSVLFSRYTHLVYGTCCKYIKDPEACRDLTMEVFEKALIALPDKNIHSFNSWIYSVSRNLCISSLRASEKSVREEAQFIYFTRNEASFMENEVFLRLWDEDHTSAVDLIYSAIERLDDNQRLCIQLFFFEKQRYKAIQEQTGFSAKQVKSYLQNGKRRLRLIIEEYLNDERDNNFSK